MFFYVQDKTNVILPLTRSTDGGTELENKSTSTIHFELGYDSGIDKNKENLHKQSEIQGIC